MTLRPRGRSDGNGLRLAPFGFPFLRPAADRRRSRGRDLQFQVVLLDRPNRAQRRLKSSVKAACAPLGALWISYSLQAAIITTTNKAALSRVLFCSSSRLFQSVIRILLLSSSSPAPFVCLQFFSTPSFTPFIHPPLLLLSPPVHFRVLFLLPPR